MKQCRENWTAVQDIGNNLTSNDLDLLLNIKH